MNRSIHVAPLAVLLGTVLVSSVVAEPTLTPEYPLTVLPREDSRQTDSVTGAELLFLTNTNTPNHNLYFHQRSWLLDSSMILFTSSRPNGGLMAYIVETGELVRLTTADGAGVGSPVAAVNRNSVLGESGERVVEILINLSFTEVGGVKHAKVMARERKIATVKGMDGNFNESCDGRYVATGQRGYPGGPKPGITIVNTETGQVEQLCDIPDGVKFHGHVQWSITNPNWLSFAGEPHRLVVVDIRDRKPWVPYQTVPGEFVTHESWWVNDQIIYCGGVHPAPTEESHVKSVDLHSGEVRIVGAGSWWPDAAPKDLARRNWWHSAGSIDGRWIAADNWHGDIMLFEGKTTRPRLLTTNHRTYGKGDHPEVGWDRKGRQVIFNSYKLGAVTVCVATIPTQWQADLDALRIGLEAK